MYVDKYSEPKFCFERYCIRVNCDKKEGREIIKIKKKIEFEKAGQRDWPHQAGAPRLR